MLEIECLVCGKTIELPEFIDTSNYDGQLACRECGSLLHVRLVGTKVRKYEVVEKKLRGLAAAVSSPSAQGSGEEVNVDSIAKYNRLRDFLATYRASAIQLAFEQIEGIIGNELETGAYTFKSWWDNDRSHPQAFAWLEAGWQVVEVDLPQRTVTLRREPGV